MIAIARDSFPVVWAPKEFEYFLNHPCGLCLGLFVGDRLVSYFIGLLVRGELDIVSIATETAGRRGGKGACLLGAAMQDPRVEKAFLEVATDNTAAFGLYEKMGFKTMGTRKKYYQQKQDAYLMRWIKHP